MSNKQISNTRYEVIAQPDPDTDDILVPIPPILLEQLRWKEGDEITIDIDENGRYVFRKIP